jgi:hypothetical protein
MLAAGWCQSMGGGGGTGMFLISNSKDPISKDLWDDIKHYSHSTIQSTLISPLNLTVVWSAPRREGVQLKEQPGWFHRSCLPLPSTAFHTNLYSEIPEPSYFELSGIQSMSLSTCVYRDLNAGVWIYWIAYGNLFISGGVSCSKGCDWPPFCEWQGEHIGYWKKLILTGGVTVNPWCPWWQMQMVLSC